MTDSASGVIAMLCESYAEFPKAFDRNTMQAVYALPVVSCAAEKSKHPSWIWASWMHKLKVASVEVPVNDKIVQPIVGNVSNEFFVMSDVYA